MARLNLLTTVVVALMLFVSVSWWALHLHTNSETVSTGTSASSLINHHEENAIRQTKEILANLRAGNFLSVKDTLSASTSASTSFTQSGPVIRATAKHIDGPPKTSDRASKQGIVAQPPATVKLPKLHAVTYASHHGRDDRFCRSVESALRHHYELVVLGWQVPWQGLSQKLEAAHAYAASIPEGDLMLFTDAFDVLFTAEARHIVETFVARNYTILFAAECGCWPHIMEDKKICTDVYPRSPTPYRYLNSGTWIGYAKQAKIMLAEVIELAGSDFRNANDQKLVADMFLTGKHGIQLDYMSEIFQSMHRTDPPGLAYCNPFPDMQLTAQRTWQNKRTNSNPAVFHFNGGGKAYHLSMESKVWYKSKEFYSGKIGEEISTQLVTVPSQKGGKLSFEGMCPDYLSNIRIVYNLNGMPATKKLPSIVLLLIMIVVLYYVVVKYVPPLRC